MMVFNDTFRALITATRPPTLLAGLSPVLAGNVLGIASVDLSICLWSFDGVDTLVLTGLLVVALQAAANIVNDTKDCENGIDTTQRKGPQRAAASGTVPVSLLRRSYLTLFLVAAGSIAALAYLHGTYVLALGLACGATAYLYTGGPSPLAYMGLGEVTAFVFFGPIAVVGSSFLHSGQITELAMVASWGFGFIAAAMMAINNYRDRDTDRQGGKTTLMNWLPEPWAGYTPNVLLAGSLMVLLFFGLLLDRPGTAAFALTIGALVLIRSIRFVPSAPAQAHNLSLRSACRYNLVYLFLLLMVLGC